MAASNEWPLATAATDALEAKDTEIEGLLKQVNQAQGEKKVLRSTWLARRTHMLSSVTVFSGGSAARIQALCFDLRKDPVLAGITTVDGITTGSGENNGDVDVPWDDAVNRYGFVIQYATDPQNSASYSANIACPAGTFTLTGQGSAATVYFRVAAVDPTLNGHQTAWSPWTAGTAR